MGPRKLPRAFWVVAGILTVAIVTLVLVNWVFSVKRPADEPILQVNDRIFRWSDYVGILQFSYLGAEFLGQQFDNAGAPYEIINVMADNELVIQAALREGLSVSKDDIRQEMISRLVPNADSFDDPGLRNNEFTIRRNNYLSSVRTSNDQYEDIVRTDLIREQLRQKLGANLPRVQPQAFLHTISVADQDADSVERKLAAGNRFDVVARTHSIDVGSRDAGGEVGWVPRLVEKDLDLLLFGLRTGELSDPVSNPSGGWWLIRILQRTGDGGAQIRGVLVPSGAEAREVRRRVDSGESLEDLAKELSVHEASKSTGGLLGTVSVGDFDGAFDLEIEGIPLNTVSERLGTQGGVRWIKVTARTSAIEVAEDNLDVLKTRQLEDWLLRERDRNLVNYCPGSSDNCFSNLKVNKALTQIRDVSKTDVEDSATATAVAIKKAQQPRDPLGRR